MAIHRPSLDPVVPASHDKTANKHRIWLDLPNGPVSAQDFHICELGLFLWAVSTIGITVAIGGEP